MTQKYDPHKHHRRSIRLKGYDYASVGAYFVTICTQNMISRFGRVQNDAMILNDAGRMVNHEWLALARRFPHITFGPFITMPNHFHAILIICPPDNDLLAPLIETHDMDVVVETHDMDVVVETHDIDVVGAPLVGAQNVGAQSPDNQSLGQIIGAFKSITTNAYVAGVNNKNWTPFDGRLWQRNYYEHIIRNQKSFNDISTYIQANPARWEHDTYFT